MDPKIIQALVQRTNAEINEFTAEEAEQYIETISSVKNLIGEILKAFHVIGMGRNEQGIQDLIENYASGEARASMQKFKAFSATFFPETPIYQENPQMLEALTAFENQACFYKEYKKHEATIIERLHLAEQVVTQQTPSLMK